MFKKYMHVERLGSDEVAGLLLGECYVFPKIDGTNASVWMEDGILCAGSRTRQISLEADNAGFCQFVQDNADAFLAFFNNYPHLRIYGEWLVPHTLKTYRKEAWRQFYIFDVYNDTEEEYLHYVEYESLIENFPIIAPIEIVTNPTQEHLIGLLDRNTYLIEDGNGPGEGIVIKRYNYQNEWEKTVWGKIVKNEFKEKNMKEFGVPTIRMGGDLEPNLAQKYVTRGRIEKTIASMRDTEPLTRRRIPELFGKIWHELITDELWEIVKENKNPTINFSTFYMCVVEEIKGNCPELFG